MAERGLAPVTGADGLRQYPVPPGPDGDQDLLDALSECEQVAAYPTVEEYTEEELRRLYSLERERMECFEVRGVKITQELPSEDTYVAARQQPQNALVWDPLKGAVIPDDVDEWMLQLQCPPPGLGELSKPEQSTP